MPLRPEVNHFTTSIGEECIFEGTISTSSSTRIDGKLVGKIMGENSIIVGERGMISGEIKATEIIVYGGVEGIIEANRLEIKSSGVVAGEIYVGRLIVEEGGTYNGRCAMMAPSEKILIQASEQAGGYSEGAIGIETKAIKAKESKY